MRMSPTVCPVCHGLKPRWALMCITCYGFCPPYARKWLRHELKRTKVYDLIKEIMKAEKGGGK